MKLIEREYLQKLIDTIGTPDIKVITGVRRSGKSKLLEQFIEYLRANYDNANIIHINFSLIEFEDLQDYHKLYNYIKSAYKEGCENFVCIQECALCLCEHYGKHLNDVIGNTKKDKKITVQIACIRKMTKSINRKSRDSHRNIDLEALTPVSEPSVEIKEEVKQDYTQCDKIVESLNLTDNMRVALECRMAGLSYPEIGRILGCVQSTMYEYFIKMRQRYTAIYG